MSLFKAKNWWSSGSVGSDETTDLLKPSSLKLTQLGPEGSGDMIILGNTNGLLQLYKPQGSFQPTDLVLEYTTDQSILQVDTGKLIFGSDSYHIAVLHPHSFSVYTLITREGHADYGDQNILAKQYRHDLPKPAFCMVVGKFGGVKEKEFICVQSLEGLLMFYEQEMPTFTCLLPDILFPGPLEFSHCTDSFITCTSNWMIESYSYHNLSQMSEANAGKSTSGKKITADWVYNVGEYIKFIQKIQRSNQSCNLVMFGDKTLYCLNDNGTLHFMKRFDFDIICCHAYLIGWYHEPNARLMILVISETSTLLIYEETMLLWSCQLTFLPISITRGFFPTLAGALVMLSDSGEIHCCYLGTEPELFIAPPLAPTDLAFDKAQEELERLQKIINSQHDAGEINLINKAAEREIPIYMKISEELEVHNQSTAFERSESTETYELCKCLVEIALKPIDKNNIQSIQVTFVVEPPLECSNPTETLIQITDDLRVKTYVYANEMFAISSLDIKAIILFTNNIGNTRVLMKEGHLPMKLICHPVRPLKDAKYKITLSIDKSTHELIELFKEFGAESFSDAGGSNSAIAFEYFGQNDFPVTIIGAKSSQRYRLQSDGLALMNIILKELVERLSKYFNKKKHFNNTEKETVKISLYGGISNDIIQHLVQNIERHMHLRQQLYDAEDSLEVLSSQYILIQKRLMTKFRERPPTSCVGLNFLLQDTYERIKETVRDIQNKFNNVKMCAIELSCCIQLIFTLLDVIDPVSEKFKLVKSALSPFILNQEYQGWEEMASRGVVHLLRTVYAKSDKDRDKLIPFNEGDIIKECDFKKMIKYVKLLLERSISNYLKPDENTDEQMDINDAKSIVDNESLKTLEEEKNIIPSEESMLSIPQGSLFGQRQPILVTRREMQEKEEFV